MSSILKAIRKIEDDKRSQENKAPDLMIDHGQSALKSKTGIAPLAAGIIMGAVVVGVLFFVFSSNQNIKQEKIPKTAYTPSVSPPATDKAPAPKQPVANQAVMDKSSSPAPILVETMTTKEIATAPEKVVDKAEKKLEKKSPTTKLLQVKAPVKPVDVAPVSTIGVTLARPEQKTELVVSEIFYQADPASSMAVVNDLPVMVGTYIGDVLVKAINEDSVTFDASGQSFSVQLQAP